MDAVLPTGTVGLTAKRSPTEGGDWMLEGMADSAELLFFRPPGRTDRQVRIGLRGGLTWMYQDRNGRWRSRRVRGGEEAGIDEALEALPRLRRGEVPTARAPGRANWERSRIKNTGRATGGLGNGPDGSATRR